MFKPDSYCCSISSLPQIMLSIVRKKWVIPPCDSFHLCFIEGTVRLHQQKNRGSRWFINEDNAKKFVFLKLPYGMCLYLSFVSRLISLSADIANALIVWKIIIMSNWLVSMISGLVGFP